MKKAAAYLLALALSLLCAGAFAMETSVHRYEGDGYATPEEAVQSYLEGLKAGDLDAMLRAFAIESYVAGYDLTAIMEHLGSYDSSAMKIRVPNENAFTQALNVEARKAQLVDCFIYQTLTFHVPELDLSQMRAFGPEDKGAEIQALLAQFAALEDPAISRLVLTGFFAPERFNDLYLSVGTEEIMAWQRAAYGAEEIRSVVAGFTVDGTPYLFCCDAARYGEVWYLLSLNGRIGNILGISFYAGGITPAQP